MAPRDLLFTPEERQWLKEKMKDAEVQEVLEQGPRNEAGTVNNYLRKAADIVEAAFKERFTSPDPGESPDAFEARRKSSHHSSNELRRRQPETQEEFAKRRAKWHKVSPS